MKLMHSFSDPEQPLEAEGTESATYGVPSPPPSSLEGSRAWREARSIGRNTPSFSSVQVSTSFLELAFGCNGNTAAAVWPA